MKPCYDTFPTPVGDFSVALDPRGAVIATAFGGLAALQERFTAGECERSASRLAPVRRTVAAYFAGQINTFALALAPQGTPFQQRVWTALQQIPSGETRTYGELAAAMGCPTAARAVGRANATNPIVLFIPCHRVIGRDGTLTGYAFGEAIKRRLLAHEQSLAPTLV